MKNNAIFIILGIIIIMLIGNFYVNNNSDDEKDTFSLVIKETTNLMSLGNSVSELITIIKNKYPYELGQNNQGDFGNCIWLCKSREKNDACSRTQVFICDKKSSAFEKEEADYKISQLPTELHDGKTYRVSGDFLVWYSDQLSYTLIFSKSLLKDVEL